MDNIALCKSDEGYWLTVKTSDGRCASLLIDNMKCGPLVNETFLAWAAEEIKRQEKK
ncbi:hypothetical protein LCGC14_1725390 [marine sediment metagenome]|uniref:Uncharacterized protein n=1 Tax=marine sediment metagenome TaxID=412755 RepID=A0A0F9JRU4_9ZZZZ